MRVRVMSFFLESIRLRKSSYEGTRGWLEIFQSSAKIIKMIKLKAKDAYVLGRVAQYSGLANHERSDILKQATTEKARQIGKLIIYGRSNAATAELRQAARDIKEWAASNRARVRSGKKKK